MQINILLSGYEDARKQLVIPVGWKPHISVFGGYHVLRSVDQLVCLYLVGL